MLRDFEFFKTKLQHIDGFGNTGDYLIDIVKSKQVKSASPPPPSEEKTEEKKDIDLPKKDGAKGEGEEKKNSTEVVTKSKELEASG